ncbi:MAG: class IV adenylate cyclase [Infirmifilum sp.]|jgi:adenylate cyclase class 2|uniref:class IV adenylate cyclase n=1 Tax=Infirmifilum TaxID=2856573 RepID=UPI002357DB03
MEPIELEAKFRCNNIDALREKLQHLKAIYLDKVLMVDVYFQHPCRDFRATDEALRVRYLKSQEKREALVEMTYKGPRGEGWVKTRVELGVVVDNFDSLLTILKKLGFHEVARIKKDREFYLFNGVEVSLDKVEDLGSFVELEDKGAGEEGIKKVAETLGLKELVPETYLELYLKKHRSVIE